MLIVIDIGNSDVVIATFADDKIITTLRTPTCAECIEHIPALLQEAQISPEDFTGCIISSTVPAIIQPMHKFIASFFKLQAKLVHELQHDLIIDIDNPEKLGTDILANCFAAHCIYKKNCIIVDFGTALTFSAITQDKKFLGACITTGLHTSLNALIKKAAQLKHPIKLSKPNSVLRKNTDQAINSGIFTSFNNIVGGNIKDIKNDYKHMEFISVVTGGSSSLFNGQLNDVDFFAPDLTMHGLRLLYDFNNK